MGEQILVGVNEGAEMLNVGRTKLYGLIGNGTIKAYRQGKRTVIRVDDLHRYADALPQIQPTPPSSAA